MQFIAKTLEDAIALGLKELGTTEDMVDITIIEQPVRGFLGMMKGKAVIKMTKKESDSDRALNFVQGIIDIMELNAKAQISEKEDSTIITLSSDDSSSVIGYRGEVLDAIQTLAGAAMNIGKKDYRKVVVDCENYRDKREETLIKLANKLEEKATDMRREVILEPMSPYERRIIHTALAGSATVVTKSEGQEPNRYVVIVPNDKDEFSKPYNAGRNQSGKNSKRDGGRGVKKGSRPNGNRGQRREKSGGERKKSSFAFGTYLGNSLKDNSLDK
jgi:spoIIIJ-associated protein